MQQLYLGSTAGGTAIGAFAVHFFTGHQMEGFCLQHGVNILVAAEDGAVTVITVIDDRFGFRHRQSLGPDKDFQNQVCLAG